MTARRYHSSDDCPPLSRVPRFRLRVLLVLRHRLPFLAQSPLLKLGRANDVCLDETDRPSAARVERRFVRLSFSREVAATSTSTSGATTSTRACANLAPRTTNRGLELGACLPPLLVNAEERRHERETTPSFPFSATWGKRKLRRAAPAIYRMARSAKILQGSSLV